MGIHPVKQQSQNLHLSRVDSNHDLPGPKPSALPLELRLHISNPHHLVPVGQPNGALADDRISADIEGAVAILNQHRATMSPNRRHLFHQPGPRQNQAIAANRYQHLHDDLLSEVKGKVRKAQGEGFEPPTLRFRAGRSSVELSLNRFSGRRARCASQAMGERLDSNQQPEAYEAPALPLSYAPEVVHARDARVTFKSRELGSNQQPAAYEAAALPIELSRPGVLQCSDRDSNPPLQFGRLALCRLSYHCFISSASGGTRTRGLHVGNVAFCQLNYQRKFIQCGLLESNQDDGLFRPALYQLS